MPADAIPTLHAATGPGERAAVEVIGFDGEHARRLLGPHLHADLELMYYAEGRGTDRLGAYDFDVSAGDLLLIAPGIVHDASALGSARGWAVEFGADAAEPAGTAAVDPESARALWWANPLLGPFLTAGRGPAYARFSVPAGDQPRWAARFAHMELEQTRKPPGWRGIIDSLLHVMLIEVARLAGPPSAGLEAQGQTLLARVFELIDQRYEQPLSTGDIAAAVGMNPGHLTTVVRERTGRPVLDWILEKRMAAARDLLLHSDLSAEEIARRVGFSDPTYFSRRFRAYHGLAPGRWRAAGLAQD